MKSFNRILSCLLLIAMLFTMLPVDGLIVNADNAITQGNTGTLAAGGKSNPNGGVVTSWDKTYDVTFRVAISRDKSVYNDGTPEAKNSMIEAYKYKYPNIDTYSEALFFEPYDVSMGNNQGTGYYDPSSKQFLWSTAGEKHDVVVKLQNYTGSATGLNKIKTALLRDGFGKDSKPLSELSNGRWQDYLSEMDYNSAVRLWSYILGEDSSGYHVDTRMGEVVSSFINGANNLMELDATKRQDISAGYVSVLMSLYKIAQTQNANGNLGTLVGYYYTAIEDYVSNNNIYAKPVGIVIDTAIPMVFHKISPSGSVYLHIPSIDYLEYTALIPQDASVQGPDGDQFVKNNIGKYSGLSAYGYAGIKGVTRNQLIAGASEGLEDIPIEETKYGNGPYRVADYVSSVLPRTAHQASILTDPFCWGGVVPGWNKERLSVGRGWAESYEYNTNVQAGFMEMVNFYSDGSTDIDGFLITSCHVGDTEPTVYYKVDAALKAMQEKVCDTVAKPKSPNQVTFVVKAESSAISALEVRMKTGDPNVSIDLSGKVYRETYVDGNLVEGKKEIVILSNEISKRRMGEELLSFLKGSPQVLIDTTVFTDEFERDTGGAKTVTYKYYIEELKIKIGTSEYEYNWDNICTIENGVAMNYAEHVMTTYRIGGEPVEDIVIPKPSSTTDLTITNPSINEVESTLINRYDFSTGGNTYAEVKSNTPNNEKYEAMAGIPSTEEIYFSAGGSEFKLAIVLQYWMNENGVDRTYRSYYSGTDCEYNNDVAGKGDTWKGITVPSASGPSSSDYTLTHNGDGTVTATWTGSIPWTGKKEVNGSCPFNVTADVDTWDWSAYNTALSQAHAWENVLKGTTISWTAASDKQTREYTLQPTFTSNQKDSNGGNSDQPNGASKGVAKAGSHGDKTVCTGSGENRTCTTTPHGEDKPGSASNGTAGSYTITVTATIKDHMICGPCCGHTLPAIEDTWKQGIVYDYVKISQLRLYKIDQASVTGMEELVGTDEIFANIKSGDPTYFLNIAQLNQKTDPIHPFQLPLNAFAVHRNTIYSGENRTPSQSSQHGRLRYSVEPQQHDKVEWNEGVRTNKCDGLATSNNFGKSSSNNVKPSLTVGHINAWAVGTLYTNSSYAEDYNHHMTRDGLTNKTAYSDKADDKDVQTTEWKKFDERRRTKNVATVISDFLILQTSGGDQSIFYFHKQTEPTETQEHFQKVKATEEEMFTNNPASIFNKAITNCVGGESVTTSPVKVDADFINIGGYNGNYKDVTAGPATDGKYEPYNTVTKQKLAVNGIQVGTFIDNDPAGTLKRPARTGKFMMYEDGIQIKPTAANKVYTPNTPKVFYKQVVAYYSNDYDRLDTQGRRVGALFNIGIGMEASKQVAQNLVKWGDQVGLQYNTTYSSTIKDGVNSIVVYTPVSAEDATILPLEGIDLNGDGDTKDPGENRDQRADGVQVVDLNAQINKFKICPLDPALCEFRTLNCKYLQDTQLAAFDFEPTYIVTERQNVNGNLETVNVTKNNTYQSGGKWITTNKITGIEYVLPTGFTIGNSGVIGTGQYLNAFGTRWSIPFSDLGLSADKSNRVSVSMDFYMNANATNKSMLVSFWNYDFWINPNDGTNFGVFNTGDGFQGVKGAGAVTGNAWNRKVHVELVFGFNNVMDCSAKIDGVPAQITVKKTEPVWQTVNGVRKLVNQVTTVTDVNNAPENLTKENIGNTINIGSWGYGDSYPANFYIDNLEIWLKGGTHTHNSSCYTNVKVCETSKIHVHDDKCYVKEDKYNCDYALNANYQLGCGKTTTTVENCSGVLNTGGAAKTYYRFAHNSGCTYNGYVHLSTSSSTCSLCGHSCGGYSTQTLAAGKAIWYHNNLYANTHISDSSTVCTECGSNVGSVILNSTYTSHTHTAECYHVHSGTAGLDYANGCYTKATEHKHNKAACSKVTAGTLQCTGELNTLSDYNTHIHSADCLTTAVTLPSVTFNYTGGVQTYTVPADGYYILKAWGASGGGADSQQTGSHKGLGGYTEGRIYLRKGETIQVYVGGEGKLSTGLNTGGGWNGGGHGGTNGFGGGGATDFRLSNDHTTFRNDELPPGASPTTTKSLLSRIMVAGGGGGADNLGDVLGGADDGSGGNGGNLVGQNARKAGVLISGTVATGEHTSTATNGGGSGFGGSQTGGYRFGIGESATYATDTGGAGGGYYGGLVSNHNNGGAGGGSSYISGHAGVNSMSMYGVHNGSVNHYSGKIFTNTKMEQGINRGDGKAEIIPENPAVTNILDKIVAGEYNATQMKQYLGQEVMELLWGPEVVMYTWSNWTTSNMKGFNRTSYGIGSTISAVSNNLRVVQNSSNWEFKVPVSVNRNILTKIEIVLDNNTNATAGAVGASSGESVLPNGTAQLTSFTMQANTNNQKVVIIPKDTWVENIGTLWFDITSGAKYDGSITIKSIKLYGYGHALEGTGEVLLDVVKTPQDGTTTTVVPKYVKKTTTTRYTNGVAGTPTTTEEEVTALGSPSTTDKPISTRTKLVGNGDTWEFSYTGGVQTFNVPASGNYKLEVYGAEGGTSGYGGKGGYAVGNRTFTSGQIAYIYVGGQNGWNGGGSGNQAQDSGGGATDIRVGGTAYSDRVIVAGGGGGYGGNSSRLGGAGGGDTGSDGLGSGSGGTLRRGGKGATQTSGGAGGPGVSSGGSGSLGQGGSQTSGNSSSAGGGGGGGYYGGGAGGNDYPNYNDRDDGGGGGGSGYVGSLSNSSMSVGVQSGNGKAVVTALQDIYSGDDVFDRVAVTYYETTKTVVTPHTVVNETTTNKFEPLKITYAGEVTEYKTFGTYTFTAPRDGKYSFEAWGASGSTINNGTSGKGGYTYGEITLRKGDVIYVYVGEKGSGNSEANPTYTFNGGGYSGLNHAHLGGRGGGATDFRLVNGSWDNSAGLISRIMVAGGGGAAGCASNHLINGDAGGLVGFDTLNGGTTYYGYVAKGGTQTSGLVGNRNGQAVSASYSKAGLFGKGAINAQCGGGGGGGYYGGGSTYTAGGAGGSSFISGMAGANAVNASGVHTGSANHYSGKVFTNTLMRAGNETMPKPTGGTEVGHIGDGYAKVTYITEKPTGSEIRKTILDNVDLIPSYLENGQWNPIFLCKGIPLNQHIHTDNCKTYTILNCTEPHHSGEHYDGSNRICWDACGNDNNHKIVKDEIELEPGVFVKNAKFLQIDHEFTVYFPNTGDFRGNDALGLSTPQSQTGYGYANNMDTTQWTREKRVKFPFNVIHKGEMYMAGNWIELDVRETYFDFYLVLANSEASNAPVEFEVEAINAGTAYNQNLQYRAELKTTYATALTNFKTSLQPKFLEFVTNGYKATDEAGNVQGYRGYFTWKQAQETSVLTAAKNQMKSIIWSDFNGGTGKANTNDGTPVANLANSINERAKPITTNDNKKRPSNLLRSSSLESLHGGYKYFYLDVIGRIGNFAIVDTEDYRFSNFFKLPKTDPAEWLVEGFIYKVEEAVQNYYLGDQFDIRGNRISEHTKWLNTYGTQTWMQGTPQSGRNVNNPNIKTQVLTGGVNNIEQLKKEQLRFGYDIYASINTIGNYQKGRVLITPYYYALNLETGSVVPLDVYISKDGIYEPVNLFNNSTNGKYNEPVYEYNMNLDWTTESGRRNFVGQEYTETQRVAEFGKVDVYDYSPYGENNIPPEDFEPTYVRTENYTIPNGAYNYLGNAQSMLLNPSHRTFVGSEESNGNATENAKWGLDKNPGDKIPTVNFSLSAQRWHFKIGIPSSSVFVRHGFEPTQMNIDEIMDNDKYAILSTLSVVAIGTTWDIEYKQPWVSSVEVNGKYYDVSKSNLPPIVAVFASDKSSVQDVDIIKTH